MHNLKKTPISELSLDSSIEKVRNKLLEEKEKVRNDLKEIVDNIPLERLANYNNFYYSPYLLDFGIVLERIKGDNARDAFEESLKVKADLLEQLSKMEYVPSFNEECHIESNEWNKCTSIASFIRKNIFRKKKYRLIFHGKEASYTKVRYNTIFGNILSELF